MFLGMKAPPLDSPDELLALRALVAEQAAKLSAQEAEVMKRDSIIGLLRSQLELLRHRQHGASSEKIDRKIVSGDVRPLLLEVPGHQSV